MNLRSKIEAKILEIKASKQNESLQTKIAAKMELQKSLKSPVKGKGSTILLRLGEGFNQSGNPYEGCKDPKQAVGILLEQIERYFGAGEHSLIYRSDNSLLISIDGTFYEITGFDLKNSVLKFARAAGVPFEFIGSTLQKLLLEDIVKLWQKLDPNYNEINRLVK